MRIVTLNTWKNDGDYPRRLALMGAGLAELEADVVCLQECFVADGFDTAAALAEATGLRAWARPSRAKTRSHLGRSIPSSSGLAMLCRFPGNEAAIALPSDDADGERIAQRLDVADAGPGIRLVNLHLTHLRGEVGSELRRSQVSAALDWSRAGWDAAIVFAGDFNAPLDAPELAPMAGQGALSEDRTGAPPRTTLLGAHVGAAAPGARAIDHLLLFDPRGDWRVRSRTLALDAPDPEGWFPSDHAAVVLDLEARSR